ncbi:MAG: hypothetical protein HN509_04200 [Halobacteriovoraceae bacterium]|nr:hypothetical protein [Halobacteriovoraceae bacterium]MBT5094237.1 hypothetical protein [Halobacteriovoraceae bacterium]
MKLLIFLPFFMFIQASYAVPGATWKKTKTRLNVEVFEGKIANSKLVAFRGKGIIDAPIQKVASVIHDTSLTKEWVSDLVESHVLSRLNTFEKIEYNQTHAPWPLSNRDFVYSVKVAYDKSAGVLKILMGSATHKDAPKLKNIVRGELRESSYTLKSIDGGKRTDIMVEILADPKGAVPKWIVNIFQSVWPSNTIDNIRKIATRKGHRVHPDIARFMAK